MWRHTGHRCRLDGVRPDTVDEFARAGQGAPALTSRGAAPPVGAAWFTAGSAARADRRSRRRTVRRRRRVTRQQRTAAELSSDAFGEFGTRADLSPPSASRSACRESPAGPARRDSGPVADRRLLVKKPALLDCPADHRSAVASRMLFSIKCSSMPSNCCAACLRPACGSCRSLRRRSAAAAGSRTRREVPRSLAFMINPLAFSRRHWLR
jgi:hypothetical protein